VDKRGIYRLLAHPRAYGLKTRLLSLGRPSVRDYLRAHHAPRVDGPVLDVACGTATRLADLGPRAVGVDISPPYLAFGQRHAPGRLAQMDAARLAFPDGTFVLVTAVGLCHHLPDDAVRAAAAELRRVTRRGGEAVIVDGVLPGWRRPLGQALFACDRGGHTRTLGALAALLGPLGYACACPCVPGGFPFHRAVFTAPG